MYLNIILSLFFLNCLIDCYKMWYKLTFSFDSATYDHRCKFCFIKFRWNFPKKEKKYPLSLSVIYKIKDLTVETGIFVPF